MRGSGHWLARHRFKHFWLSLSSLAFFAFAWVPWRPRLPPPNRPFGSVQPRSREARYRNAPLLPESTPVAEFPVEGGDLTVFAAASLTDAFEAMSVSLEAATPISQSPYNFGGSLALVTQLKEGAQADVFASANIAQMDVAIAADARRWHTGAVCSQSPGDCDARRQPRLSRARPISARRESCWFWPNRRFPRGGTRANRSA